VITSLPSPSPFSANAITFGRLPFWLALTLGTLLALPGIGIPQLAAQPVTTVVTIKEDQYQQSSADKLDYSGSAFGLGIEYTVAPPVSVQLRLPSGELMVLSKTGPGLFFLVREFPTTEAMDQRFPDGPYEIIASGGQPASSFGWRIETGSVVSPIPISNYNALQAWPNVSPEIRWDPDRLRPDIPELVRVSVSRAGATIYQSGYLAGASNGQFIVSEVPSFVPLVGELGFFRFYVRRANPSVEIAAGRAFSVRFPFESHPSGPFITVQPAGVISRAGADPRLSVAARGDRFLNYRWMKDGIPIPGGRQDALTVRNVQPADAGVYTVAVEDIAGTVVSAPAIIGIAPEFRFTLHAGTAGQVGAIDGGPNVARFGEPEGLAPDGAGGLFVTDVSRHVIRRIDANGIVSPWAGMAGLDGHVDGAGEQARFNRPWHLASDRDGTLYVSGNNTVRKISASREVTTLAGTAGRSGTLDGIGPAARFTSPGGLAVDDRGNVFVADQASHVIRKITPGGVVSTIAGQPGMSGNTDGLGGSARFNEPRGLAIDATGTLYVADYGNRAIRTISAEGRVATFVWSQITPFSTVALDGEGNVYATAGIELARFSPLGTPNAVMPFLAPQFTNVVVTPEGRVFVAATSDRTIREVALIPGTQVDGLGFVREPRGHVVVEGGSVVLGAAAEGPSLAYQWRKDGSIIRGASQKVLIRSGLKTADSGNYDVVISNLLGARVSAPARISVVTGETPSRLANLSIRTRIDSDARILTLGAVLGGSSVASPVPLLVRGIGPGLEAFGVERALPDPALTVFRDERVVASNEDWSGTAGMAETFTAVGAFPLRDGSRDAALAQSFPAGAYSVRLQGRGVGAGIGLAEIYDLSTGRDGARLVNLSALAEAGTREDTLIAGFGISGSVSKTLLIRGVGPTLSRYGVTGYIAEPMVNVYSGARRIATGADWDRDVSLADTFRQVGAFALSSPSDVAFLVTLEPGSYSVQLSGNREGIGLVEIYEVP
jgi:sugar lactone lactonase YvrE